jgi:hypothetical protein
MAQLGILGLRGGFLELLVLLAHKAVTSKWKLLKGGQMAALGINTSIVLEPHVYLRPL